MQILELKIFRDIAHEKSFVKAAKLNFLTQPSASLHLKHLEEKLGARLFERSPRKVRLTPQGESLLPHVEDLLVRCDNLKTLTQRTKRIASGDIRIATIPSIGEYEFTPFLKKFMRAWPDIQIHLQYRRADIIYDLVLKNKIDLGIVAYPENRPKIKVIPLGSDELVLITPPKHSLGKKRNVSLEHLQDENFIAFSQELPTRQAIDEALAKRNVTVKIRMTNDNVDMIKRAVEIGMGIAVVPSQAVLEEVGKKTLRSTRLRDIHLTRPLGILTLRDRVTSYPVELFISNIPRV